MIESVFIISMAMGFILFILAIEQKSVVYSLTSLLMWIFTWAGSVYIRSPGTTEAFNEFGMTGICLAFIIINIMWSILIYMDLQYWNKKIR